MRDAEFDEYGTADLNPATDVVVGTYHTWKITYTVGNLGMDDGSTVKIAGNMTSDWGIPQFENPQADNYATVETSGAATVEAAYDPQGHVRPWKQTVTIDVFDGSLDEGDTITLTLGDRKGGSLGHRAQSFPEEDFRIAVLVDAFGTGEFVQLQEDLTFDVIPGMADSASALAPSTVSPGEEFTVSLRVEDFWGNTATQYGGTFTVTTDDSTVDQRLSITDGTGQTSVQLYDPGTYRLELDDQEGLSTTTNPVTVGTHDKEVFWGDLHGQSGETVGTGTIWDYFEYARDNAFLDFASHAGNDFQITDEFWDEIQNAIQEFHDPGNFVTFLCYEWSSNTSCGGDHNVYFRDSEAEIHRSSSWQIADGHEKHAGVHPVSQLYDLYDGHDDVLIIPHQGGRPATLDTFDPDLSPFVEIVSVWGVFEWFGNKALDQGYPVGFVGGSDDHTGRPGATHPTNRTDFTIDGGLMAVRADDLSRDALWNAFNQRRCYATTGARILLETTVNDTGMGGSVAVDGPPEVAVTVKGTAPLNRIDLFRGSDRVDTHGFDTDEQFLEFTWSGARSNTRHKVQDWSGGLSMDRGRIRAIEEFGFDHPEQGITHRTNTTLRWDGATAGNYQGVRVQFDAPRDATVSFATDPVDTTFTLDDIDEGLAVDAGYLEQQLQVRRVGTFSEREAEVTLTDQKVDAGSHPYYVRVTQSDGEMAWSSPIFVEV
jgi:hypothetical protein